VAKSIPNFSRVSRIPSNQKIRTYWKLILSCVISNLPKPALGGNIHTFYGRLMSLRQNILSAIKVMKQKVSKKDRSKSRRDLIGFFNIFRVFFLEVYVKVRIRTENLEVSPRIRIKFWKKVRITKFVHENTPFRGLSGVLLLQYFVILILYFCYSNY
jgi:site-specific recombinase